MRVKSIILDGFKSYAHRKLLDDLSPHFNAITGLNGSGKSNIFDAICFVMGITNLKRVRAEDPRELIYHGGSRGVHTARVTIEFWNDDPKTAPPGYGCEDYPIITVGRQISNKGKQQFFLNNAVSMQSKVKRFFESISLNVDNPHFMVLQGTVHKLIGMRSSDILALIEEAVGTKTFDHRRRTAENLIRGKERKMKEIEENITTQIGPMLQVMKADQEEYNRFIHLNATLDERRRFRVAYEYFQRTEAMATKDVQRVRLSEDLALVKSQVSAIPSQESDASAREKQLQESMLAPAESAAALHEEEGDLKRVLARYKTQLESADRALKAGEQQLKKLHKDQTAHARQVEQLTKLKSKREALLESIHTEKEDVANLKKALQLHDSGVRAGLSGVSLEEELHRMDGSLIALDAEIRRRNERHSELETELKRIKARNDHDAAKHAQLKKEMDAAVSRHRDIEAKYADIAPLEAKAQQLQQELMASREEHHKLNDAYLREMSSGGGNFDVQFAHPSSSGAGGRRGSQMHGAPGASAGEEERELRKHILGRVGELVRPNEERFGIALTVGAQAQLMRVVTTDDTVVERIIARGLRQRTSFLPLNRLTAPRTIDQSRLEQARRIAASHSSKAKGGSGSGVKAEPFVAVARDLVEVDDPRCKAVADVVFGGFLVCSDLNLAQALAYHPQVKCKAVTLDGEVADPNGLMSGGSMQSLRDMFAAMRAHRDRKAPLRRLSEQIQEQEVAYEGLRVKLGQHAAIIKAFRDSEETVEMATHRFQLVQGSSKSELEELAAAMEAEQTARTEAVGRRDELRKRKEEITAQKLQDPTNMRKEIQGRLRDSQQRLKALQDEEDTGVAAFEKLEAETEQRASDLEAQCKECEEEIALRTDERSKVLSQLERTQEELRDVDNRCRQAEEQRQRYEKELEDVREEQQRLAEQRANLEGTLKNHESDIKELHKSIEAMKKAIAHDERTHMWLESQRDHFGDVEGPFFFRDAARTEKALQELREAEAHAAVMGRKMNKKASILYDERKKEYDDLVEQLKNLGEDRGAIQQCIQGIEAKKWSALDRMVRVISAIFSKLFSTCLPGAAVQLREERDNDTQHLIGLNVKVTFNGKEKESLSELSGGQRSLLALCLILAILRVRQAPVYILDEVDAALDPSHTQNIGRMLQTHFPGSQFLLVSLKDGMYNNADVLYQIRNTQGFSEVTRIAAKRQQQPQS